MLKYGEEQLECIDTIVTRIKNHQDVTVIWGPAGSGKTSIVAGIVEKLGLDMNEISFATFTGKAALVLRKKGFPASTIHKLIYKVYKDRENKLHFRKRIRLQDDRIKLIIIDEYYMVGDKLFKDLLSFNVPILCLGDPYQLPPVRDNQNKYSQDCDFFLTKNYRQKDGNTILELANDIRKGEDSEEKQYNDSFIRTVDEVELGMMLWADQVLCCTNRVRKNINALVRDHLGRTGNIPEVGDKIICTRNDWNCLSKKGEPLVNGMIGYVTAVKTIDLTTFKSYMDLEFRPEHDKEDIYDLRIDLNPFLGYYPYKNSILEPMPRESFDFGYAISIHKAQGSEWDKVLVYSKDLWGEEKTKRQLLYTGVTRAKEKLILVK